MENQIDTNTLVVDHKVNVVRGQDQLPYECSYEVTFNGEDRVDLAMAGCSVGWVPRFTITLTPPDGTQVYKMLYEFVDGLEPRPFENMGVTEYEDNVGMAKDQLVAIKRDLENMAKLGESFMMPKTWRYCFDFMIRPVMRFSRPVFTEDIEFAHPIPEDFANLEFVIAGDIDAKVGMKLLAQYSIEGVFEPCVISELKPDPEAEDILFQVIFEDERTVGVFYYETVKIVA